MRDVSPGESDRPHTHTHKNTTGTDPSSHSNGLRDAVSAALVARAHEATPIDGNCTTCGGTLNLTDTGFVACQQPECRTEPEADGRAFVRYAYREDTDAPYVPASREPKPRPMKDYEQPPINRVLAALHAAGCDYRANVRDADTWQAQCPTHDDSRPSLLVRRNGDGSVWLKCWAACSKEGILDALGLEWRDLWEASERDFDRAKPNVRPLLPPHLRRAIEDLLRRDDELRAA